MKRRWSFWIAWGSSAFLLILILCAVVLAVKNGYDLGNAAFLLTEASAALIGGLIVSRQPGNPVGWFVLGHAFCFTLGEFCRQFAIYGVQTSPGSLPFGELVIWPTYWVWYSGLILLVVLLPLYFPNGRLVSNRWRWIVRLAVLLSVVASVLNMFRPGDNEAPGIPNPLGLEDYFRTLQPLSEVLEVGVLASWLVLSATAAVSLVVRFQRSRVEERQQIKWFVYAVVFLVVANVAGQLLPRDLFPTVVEELLFVISLESLWVAIAFAILAYRLYDIDIIINRTLVYSLLTALLGLAYFGSVVVLQYLLHTLTGGGSQLAIVASTLAIAALFSPLRSGVQVFIDRRFYRKRYDAAETLRDFSGRLRNETNLSTLNEDLVAVVGKTMQPEHVSLWLRNSERFRGRIRDERVDR